MKLSSALALTKQLIAAGQNVFLVGQPGIGKTEGVKALVSSLTAADVHSDLAKPGDEDKPVRSELIVATTLESVDIRGIAGVQGDNTVWYPPRFIPQGDEPAVVFVDEAPQADYSVMIALQRFVDRDLDNCQVSKRTVHIWAGNRVEDNSGANVIPQHIRNRFCFIHVDVDPLDWVKWAEDNGVLPILCDFIAFRPDMLNTFNAESSAYSYATPRSVTRLSKALQFVPESEWGAVVSGFCGEEFAAEFTTYRKLYSRVPKIEDLLDNAGSIDLSPELGIQRACCSGVLRYLKSDESRYDDAITYLGRVGDSDHKEFAAAAIREILVYHRKGSLKRNPLQDKKTVEIITKKFQQIL